MGSKLKNYYYILLILCLLWGGAIIAQDESLTRVLDTRYDTNNDLVLHVQSSEPIISASLAVDNQSRNLTINPDSLTIEHWLILDAGDSMVDSYPLIRDTILQNLDLLIDNNRMGIMTVGDEQRQLDPTDDGDDIRAFLTDYRAMPFQDVCLTDTLESVLGLPRFADTALTVTLITGQVDYPNCDAVADSNHPIDVLVIGQQQESAFTEQVRQKGGQVRFVALLQASTILDDLLASADTVYALTLALDNPIESAILTLELESGASITETIRPNGQFTSIDPVESENELQTTTPTIEATAEVIPSPIATPIPEPDSPIVRGGFSNISLITMGGAAAIAVVIAMMAILLGIGRRSSHSDVDALQSTDTDLKPLSDSTINPADVATRLDQTEIATMRELAAQLGATHVADLVNAATNTIYEIHSPVSLLGRQLGSDILIADDNQISREHVRFETRDNGIVWIIRLTNNPILLNGVPMENTRQLNEGDVLQLSPQLQVQFTKFIQEAE